MNAKELRIGNLVLKNGESYCIATGEDIGNCDFDNPIPITEEWLNKLGFIKGKDGYTFYDGRESINSLSIQIVKATNWHLIVDDADIILDGYVHEVQNLYFAIMKQELS